MADTQVFIGDTPLFNYEVPERIPFGGGQHIEVHKLIGGTRIIDALGPDDMPVEWSGRFQGPNAVDRARHIDFLRKQGQPVNVSWDFFQYSVIIERFEADYERVYQAPYKISCVVIQDLTAPIQNVPAPSIDDMMLDDINGAAKLAALIAISQISIALGTLQNALYTAELIGAPPKVLASIRVPLTQSQLVVATTITSIDAAMAVQNSLGGVQPGNPPSTNAANLNAAITQTQQLGNLIELRGTLGRMSTNLKSARMAGNPANLRQVTVAGGNLFQLAAQYLGDAQQWHRIAALNGLWDPMIVGVMTLLIPPVIPNLININPNLGGGVLGSPN